ncbi:unnamed protein product, partial [Clonostachys rosea]
TLTTTPTAKDVRKPALAYENVPLGQESEEDPPLPSLDKFHFAIICALPKEYDAVIQSVEYQWPTTIPFDPNDENIYTLAKMGGHKVVIALQPKVGPGQSQTITEALKRKFTKVILFLVVGICGAVPIPQNPENVHSRIFLGDVVISKTIAQYLDQGQIKPGGVASGHIIMRSGEFRDMVSREQNILAFEMEGAGVQIGSSSCLIIKAACDYADSHKKKDFQEYAAGVAASAAKAVLQTYPTDAE